MTSTEVKSYEMQLARCLRDLLQGEDVSVAHLARRTGVPQQTIHNWLTGQMPKNILQVKAVADFFALSVDELVFGASRPRVAVTDRQLADIKSGEFELILRPLRREGKQDDQEK